MKTKVLTMKERHDMRICPIDDDRPTQATHFVCWLMNE